MDNITLSIYKSRLNGSKRIFYENIENTNFLNDDGFILEQKQKSIVNAIKQNNTEINNIIKDCFSDIRLSNTDKKSMMVDLLSFKEELPSKTLFIGSDIRSSTESEMNFMNEFFTNAVVEDNFRSRAIGQAPYTEFDNLIYDLKDYINEAGNENLLEYCFHYRRVLRKKFMLNTSSLTREEISNILTDFDNDQTFMSSTSEGILQLNPFFENNFFFFLPLSFFYKIYYFIKKYGCFYF